MNEEAKREFRERLREFTDECSLHGVKLVLREDQSRLRSCIWLILLCGSMVLFGLTAGRFITHLRTLTTNTKIKVLPAKSLTFPTVTICNKNIWRADALFDYSMRLYNDDSLVTVFAKMHIFEPPITEEKYNVTCEGCRFPVLPDMNSSEAEHFFGQLAHNALLEASVCLVQAKMIPCKDILDLVITDGGFCAQFNSNGSFNVAAAGTSGGLRLLLNAEVDAYFVGPKSYSEGFIIGFHDSDEVPMMTEIGVGASVGFESVISIHKSEINRQPPPADGNASWCFDSNKLPNPLKYYTTYSYSGCQIECKTRYMISKCGCRDILQPALNHSRICSLRERLFCSSAAFYSFPSDPEGLKACNCSDPCIHVEYTTQVSNFRFPSRWFAAMTSFVPDFEKNHAAVEISFGKMSYTSLEESITFDVWDAIVYLGGTLGLCFGASLLSVCELMEFLLLSVQKSVRKLMCSSQKSNVIKVQSVESKEQI